MPSGPSSTFSAFSDFSERLVAARGRVLLCVLLGLAVLTGLRVVAGGALAEGGVSPPDSESARAADLLTDHFDHTPTGLVAVIAATGAPGPEAMRPVDAPALVAEGSLVRDLLAAEPAVASVVSCWDSASSAGGTLCSADGRHALVVASLRGDDGERASLAGDLAERLRRSTPAATVSVTGPDVVAAEVGDRTATDLLRAELVALPLIMVLLVLFLRGVRVALVPVAVGMLTVLGGIALMGLLAGVIQVTTFSTNIVVGLGLGLSIDYVLLLIARYREELAKTPGRDAATGRATAADRNTAADRDAAMATAVRVSGRTIMFSAATVAVSLLALAMFPVPFLRTMAVAGVIATVLAALFTVLVVPAAVALVGDRMIPRGRRAATDTGGFWVPLAGAVMRRPVVVAMLVVGVLLVLALPVGQLTLGVYDDRNLPTSSASRQAAEVIRQEFDGRESGAFDVVATGLGAAAGGAGASSAASLDAFAAELAALPDVARVTAPRVVGDAAYLSVVPTVDPNSARAEALLDDVRDLRPPFLTLVGGPTAAQVDTTDALLSRLPLVGGFIATVTLLALVAMLGSVLVPLQALLLNVLGLGATFGVLVWVFQDGNLSGLLGFTAVGSVPAAMPVLVFCVAFGVSMDYTVFLLARVREDYDRTGDPAAAIVSGMRHTGRIVTFAALLLATVFAGFITSSVTSIKLLGTGLALAVLLDACVLRALLAPALLRITGHASWWAPAPVRRLGARFGLSEQGTPPAHDARPQAAVAAATVAAQPPTAHPQAAAAHPQRPAGGR
ncbi:MMPL family transporter [Parafrankia elaeagni]|uniref:MMPL family transporter n=1 Tax=Parafrankia elaeagni TaxID=222534 RepID=UPI00035E45A8|nr:MMPL family transporter [Parafrankia elaeagni]